MLPEYNKIVIVPTFDNSYTTTWKTCYLIKND